MLNIEVHMKPLKESATSELGQDFSGQLMAAFR